MSTDAVIIGLAALVVLGVCAQWIGRRLRFASLLLLLPAGVLAGSYDIVQPQQLLGDALFPLTTMFVALLLFQSGLYLRLQGPGGGARRPVFRLVTVGALITFLGAAASAYLVVGVDVGLAALLGAILIVSGPTVVGPLLEVIRARRPTSTVLRWEGVMLDPIGASAGVVVLNILLASTRRGLHPGLQLAARLGVGITVGLVAAAVLVFVLSRFLVTDNMEAAVAIAFVVVAYTAAEVLLSEAGLVAALTLGVAAANQRVVPTSRILNFGETLEVLIIGVLFILLGALVDVGELAAVAGRSAALVALLVLVVRPVSVAVALAGTALPWRDRALIAWMCPRGIVAAATAAQFGGELTAAGFDASIILPVTFAAILGTGVVYSLTTPIAGRLLDVSEQEPTGVALLGDAKWLHDLALALHDVGLSVLVLTSRRPERVAAPGVRVVPVHETDDELHRLLDDEGVGQAVVATEATVSTTLLLGDLVEALGRRHVYRLPLHEGPPAARLLLERWSPQPFTTGLTLAQIATEVRQGATIEVLNGALPAGAVRMAVAHTDGTVDLAPGTPWASHRTRASRGVASIALVPAAATDRR